MSFWVFILCIQAGNCLGLGFPFFNSTHVPFHPLSIGWLVLLPCNCIVPTMISFILAYLVITSRLAGYSVYYTNFSQYSFFWFLLPSIPTGPVHSTPRASLAHFILQASLALFIPCASLAHFILSYLFHSHGLLLNPLGFPSLITTSFAFEQSHLLIPFFRLLRPILLLSIDYDSHELTTSFFGASSTCLLSLRPLIILWAYGPSFLPFWPNGLYFTAFLFFSYCWASSTIRPFCQKMGINI